MLFILKETAFERVVARITANAAERIENEVKGLTTVTKLNSEITSLRENLETLKIEKARREEEMDRREREIEHKVGLERKRQAVELEASKREAIVSVREENLKADQSRFEEQMKFQSARRRTRSISV